MKKITLLAAAILTGLFSQAQSFTALYPFDSVKITSGITDPTPVPVVTGITFGSFSATGTPVNPNATFRFSFTDWAIGGTPSSDVYATHTGIINTAEYYEVTITPVATYSVTLTDITFKVQRSSTGIRTYAVRSSADSYLTNLPASINPANANLSVQPGDIFYWNLDATTSGQDGSTITLSGPSFTNITSPVTFRFYGWNAEGAGGTFSIDNVTINGTVTAPLSLVALFNANSVCVGDSTDFTDYTTGPYPVISWLWNFGDGSGTSTQQNPSYVYGAPGAYEVTLTVVDSLLNTDTFTDSVNVWAYPVTDFSAPMIICGGIAQFYDSSSVSDGIIAAWMWNFGDTASTSNTASSQNPTHTFSGQGSYTVTLVANSNHLCTDTATTMISNYIVDAFLPYTMNSDTVIFAGYATGGSSPYSYLLDLGTGGGFNITTPNYSYQYPPGTYTACLLVTDNNGCTDTSCTTFTILPTRIGKNSNIAAIRILPNPSNDGLFVLNTENITAGTITVYNIIGKIIVTKQVIEGRNIIDLSSEANGSYFVHIKTDKEMITRKIIINK